MIRIANLKVGIDKEINLKKEVVKKLKVKDKEVLDIKIKKKSVDARNKENIKIIYTLDITLKDENKFKKYKVEEKENKLVINVKNKEEKQNPVVIGTGPAGLFAGLILAKYGLNPIILEQGKSVYERKKDVDDFFENRKLNVMSNIQFGEGGAGTFSDGKLTTLINSPYCDYVLKEFVKCGAPEEILYLSKPHVGTDILIKVIENLRNEIIKLGGQVYFNEKVTDIIINQNKVTQVKTNSKKIFETKNVILAIGHSARDTFTLLKEKNVSMEPKAFSVGVRIEHLRKNIDKAQYGKYAGNKNLKAAEYKMCYHGENKSAYTFCMCPGGKVVASTSEEGKVVTNGMSYHSRDLENSNSALLVGIEPKDVENNEDVLCMMNFQRKLEEKAFIAGGKNYNAPVQLVGDFLENKKSTKFLDVIPTYKPGVTFADFNEIFPREIADTLKEAIVDMDRKLNGFADKGACLTGVETRSSSPIRIKRNEYYVSVSTEGLYPCGEGAGYAGGIMSAACDGIRCAKAILEK